MLQCVCRRLRFAFAGPRTADGMYSHRSVYAVCTQVPTGTANTCATSDRFVSVYCTCREGRAETGVCAVRAIRERNETHNIKMLNHPRFRPEPRRQSPQCPVTNAPESRVQRQQCVTHRDRQQTPRDDNAYTQHWSLNAGSSAHASMALGLRETEDQGLKLVCNHDVRRAW